MVFTDVVIICKHKAQYDDENNKYVIPFYNVDDGHFWFTACISSDLYDHHIAKLDAKSQHVLSTGNLIDVPSMQDYAGLVFESRQRINVVQMNVLNSDIYVPSALVEQSGPTLVPYQFTPGPVKGYYLIVMNKQEKPVFHSINQDRSDDDFDRFDEEKFEPQDCEFDRNMAEQENTPDEFQDEFEAYQGILASEFDINFSKIMELEAGPSKSQSKSPMKSKSPAITKSATGVSSASKPATTVYFLLYLHLLENYQILLNILHLFLLRPNIKQQRKSYHKLLHQLVVHHQPQQQLISHNNNYKNYSRAIEIHQKR